MTDKRMHDVEEVTLLHGATEKGNVVVGSYEGTPSEGDEEKSRKGSRNESTFAPKRVHFTNVG